MPLKNSSIPIDIDALVATANNLKIEVAPAEKSNPEVLVGIMRNVFAKRLENIPEDNWIKCSVCGEVTDDDASIICCPFCGDEGEGFDDDEDDVRGIDAADYEDDDALEPEEAPIVDINSAKSAVTPGTAIEPAKRRRGRPKKVVDDDNEATVLPTPFSPKQHDEMLSQLNVEKEIIQNNVNKVAGSYYEMAKAIRRIHEKELWRADGCKSFRTFCKTIGLSHTFAYSIMGLVEKFTQEQIQQFGRKKLEVIAQADPARRIELLVDAEEGATKKELQQKVDADKSKSDNDTSEVVETDESKDSKEAPVKKEQLITLLAKVGGRSKNYDWINKETGETEKRWHPNTFFEVPISENVVLYGVMRVDKTGAPIGVKAAFRSPTIKSSS